MWLLAFCLVLSVFFEVQAMSAFVASGGCGGWGCLFVPKAVMQTWEWQHWQWAWVGHALLAAVIVALVVGAAERGME